VGVTSGTQRGAVDAVRFAIHEVHADGLDAQRCARPHLFHTPAVIVQVYTAAA